MFSWVEISESAIHHNLRQFRKKIGGKNLLMPVIKSNAYGHGFELVAKICDKDKNVDKICVVNSDEAACLIDLGIKKKIFILSFYSEEKKVLKKMIDRGVEFPIYRLDQIDLLNTAGRLLGKRVKVHIKIDTGTSRVGFLLTDLSKVATKLIKTAHWLEVEGIWSHFASSEDDSVFTNKQYAVFQKGLSILNDFGINPPLRHMSCTAASLGFKFADLNAFRLGLGLYGLYPDKSLIGTIRLKPVLSWKTKVIQIKTLTKGSKIGYGGTFTVKRDTKIAILPVGYWDGYVRLLSNSGEVLIKGRSCPIRGRICMNLIMVEVPTNLDIKISDVAMLIGGDKGKRVSAEDVAVWSKTINYEVVTRINPLIPRIKV